MSNHPNFKSMKKKRLKELQPGVREGWLRKKGFEVHNWKRRYFIINREFIYYFKNATANSTPKGVIELNSQSSATLTDDTFMNILISSVHRNQEVIADTPDMGAAWVDCINNHIKTLKKAEQQKNKIKEESLLPFNGKEWPEVKTEINICKHQNDRIVPAKELTNMLKRFGNDTVERYLYSILKECIGEWEDDDIADYMWNNFCRSLIRVENMNSNTGKVVHRVSILKTFRNETYKLLTDLNLCFAGTQGAVPSAFGADVENSSEIVFVLGKGNDAGIRLGNIYKYIIDNNEISFGEVIRTILDAMKNWGLRTDDEMFLAFINGITNGWGPAQVASLISFLSTYTLENNSFPVFEEPWEDLPPHALSFIKMYCEKWETEEKKEFLSIGRLLWGWKVEVFKQIVSSI
ncbi:PH domain-containing protein [Entamoeba marina]